MTKLRLLSGIFTAALLGACVPVADQLVDAGFTRMSGDEIVGALVGNSLDGEDADGEYVIYYPAKNEMRIFYQGRTEGGVWRIEGDQYCRTWKTFGNGRERCVFFYRSGDRINWLQGGRITDESFLIPGNPAEL